MSLMQLRSSTNQTGAIGEFVLLRAYIHGCYTLSERGRPVLPGEPLLKGLITREWEGAHA